VTAISYARAGIPVRGDLPRAHQEAWRRLASPGSAWSGAQRVALVQEGRNARACDLCRERRAALSPAAVVGAHGPAPGLPEAAVEAVHRLTTDPGRLFRSWFEGSAGGGSATPPTSRSSAWW
jgi:uncharacterized protein YbjT (DUF2867 family)